MDREGQARGVRGAAPCRRRAAVRAARAAALAQTIEDVAGWMTEVATFPVGADEPPAFYGGARDVSLHTLDAVDAARAIREKVLSPVDLVEALLERIDRIDGRVQAWALVDRDGARAAARQAADEAARVCSASAPRRPLRRQGHLLQRGPPHRGRSKVMAGFVPDWGRDRVARLRAAGAILLGKLHTTEFATTIRRPRATRGTWSAPPAARRAARRRRWPRAWSRGARQPDDRLERAPSVLLRAGRSQADVRPDSARARDGAQLHPGPRRAHGPQRRGHRPRLSIAAGHDPEDPSSSRAPVPDYLAAITAVAHARRGAARVLRARHSGGRRRPRRRR